MTLAFDRSPDDLASRRRDAAARPAPLPRLRLEHWFDGRSRGVGTFRDRFGTVRRRFAVDVIGRWDGRVLTLVEDFAYDDGETERRSWRISPVGDRRYRGAADGVIGVAEGAADGADFGWRYRFRLPVGGRHLVVGFDDRMSLQPDGRLINRARVTKFGLRIGEATIVFDKA